MQRLTNTFFGLLGAVVGNQLMLRYRLLKQPHPMPHQWARLLDHPWRLRYRNPDQTLSNLPFLPNQTVLEVGCGTGLFTVALARMVGETGVVHAVDLQALLLHQARQRVVAANLESRVHFHHCGAYQLPLETNSVDLALLIATLSQISNKIIALAELHRVLKPNAQLFISEELPDPAYLPSPVIRRQAEAAGFLYQGQTGTPFCYEQLYTSNKETGTVDVTPIVISDQT